MIKKFGNTLSMECRKAFQNRFFWISLLAGIIFAVLSGVNSISRYMETKETFKIIGGNSMIQAFMLYNTWIGGESSSVGYVLFYTLLPLLAVLPYGWSYQAEAKSGYLKNVEIRTGRREYLIAKYVAGFLVGGSCILLPLLFNFVLTACFVPAVNPTIVFDIYYPIHYGAIGSELFFEHPLLFVMLYLMIDFIFGGLFAAIGMAIGFFSQKRVAVILGPFLFTLLLEYCRTFLIKIIPGEISPFYFLHAVGIRNIAETKIILVEGIMILVVTLGIVLWKGKKCEDL